MAKKPKIRCNNTMTEGQFNTWIKSQLRLISTKKWIPITQTRKGTNCSLCNISFKKNTRIIVLCKNGNTRKMINKCVDHIDPVVPNIGFTSYDDYINRLFCEMNNLRLLCKKCHDRITYEK